MKRSNYWQLVVLQTRIVNKQIFVRDKKIELHIFLTELLLQRIRIAFEMENISQNFYLFWFIFPL